MSQWWYSDLSGRFGPITHNEIVKTLSMLSMGQLEMVLVWREGFDEWRGALDVPELGLFGVLPEPEHLERGSPNAQLHADHKALSQRQWHAVSKPILIGGTFIALLVTAGVIMTLLFTEPNLEADAERAVVARITDPESARFQGVQANGRWGFVCGFVNAKNKMGGYVGFQQFYFDKEVGVFIDSGSNDSNDLLARTYTKRC